LAVLRGTFHFTSRVTGTAIASFIVNQLDKIVLSKLMPLSLLGTYQIGNQVGTGAKLLATLVETVVMPRMTIQIEQGDEVGLALLYHEACQLVALLVLPFTAMVAFFAVPLLTVWLGNPTLAAAAAPVAIVLTLGSTCNAMIRVPGGLTLAKGWSGFGLYESTISGALYIPVLIMLIRSDGGLGAAWAWLLLNAACLVVDMPIIHSRYLKTEFGIWALWSLLIPAAISFGLFGAARFLMPKLSPWGATAAVAAIWTVTVLASALAMPRMRAIGARAVGRLHLLVP
jgi:O-antigen/teichoic acid export membrane protein